MVILNKLVVVVVVASQGAGPRNLVPRVLCYPPYGAREGWVGDNPGNEVAGCDIPAYIPASLDNNRSK